MPVTENYAFPGITDSRMWYTLTCFNLLDLEFPEVFCEVQDKQKTLFLSDFCPHQNTS